ncbi:putative hydrolase/uncharacterized protein, coenzyme F420 biosynthesis associated [Streptoalloteichus hindustanus]|uniref:Putative hydrolase/uncharacterized protein, coenzyme F420 biosynthesis associated n=1 Tax=Streptoalloteichus hindustanus TaxID=2017 RepID=A0A1M4VZG1_STRHI|nr:putative hydrolase/uncharacterized protein, coenzyme F420 biosynthesis associated [Streptoalloteichus hindustanus]
MADGPASVDWNVAALTASRLVRPGPAVPLAEAETTVNQLRALAGRAEGHVRELTGMGDGLPLLPAEVVDRPGWVRGAAEGLAVLTGGGFPPLGPGRLPALLSGTAGVQAGVVLAYLASRVLGQYDPFGGPDGGGRLLLVAPNVVSAQRALDVPPEDFRMWVCLHEATHRLQFTAVPWLRAHFAAEVGRLLEHLDDTAAGVVSRLPDALREMLRRDRAGGPPVALVELLQGPDQRAVLDRLIALSTLLEGHADHVMDAVGPTVVPTVATIRARFTARRRGGGLADRVLRALLGVDAKVRQYAQGAEFTRQVVDAVGMTGFNAVWHSRETLPTRAEIAEPRAWVRRVHG